MENLRDEMDDTPLQDPRETKSIKSLEEITKKCIHPDHPNRHVMIGIQLTIELRDALTTFLKRNYDVFAQSQVEVPGIDPRVVVHQLFANHNYPSILQKRKKIAPERLKVIDEEV